MPGLDVLRGIAILMVLIEHGLTNSFWVYQSYNSPAMISLWKYERLGFLGVELFFVLSGFLITGILLDNRSAPDFFRNFYTRRALRILPAYLLMLAVLRITHNITWRYLAVCLLYFCNMSKMFGANAEYGALWSLSVEEQFYLVWPFIVRKVPRHKLFNLCIALVVLTPALRFVLLCGPMFLHDTTFKTWDVGDFFAAGALVALAARSPRLRPIMPKAVAPLLLSGGLLCSFQYFQSPNSPLSEKIFHAIYLEPWLLLFSGFLLLAFLRPSISLGFFSRPLVFLANISYGLYLCHPFIFDSLGRHWPIRANIHIGLFPQLLLRFFVETAVAICIATLSRYTFEEFFLRLKPKHSRIGQPANASGKMT